MACLQSNLQGLLPQRNKIRLRESSNWRRHVNDHVQGGNVWKVGQHVLLQWTGICRRIHDQGEGARHCHYRYSKITEKNLKVPYRFVKSNQMF